MSRNTSRGPRRFTYVSSTLCLAGAEENQHERDGRRPLDRTRDRRPPRVSGTIDEAVVLAAISELATASPGNDDLFADAAMRCGSPGRLVSCTPTATSVLHGPHDGAVQLRYRSEMADVFTDLAIDIGLRDAQSPAEAPA